MFGSFKSVQILPMSAGCFETACRSTSKLSKLVGLCENLVLCLCLTYLNLIKFTLQVCIYWIKNWQHYFGIRHQRTVLLIVTVFSGKHFRMTSPFCLTKTRGHRQTLNSNCMWCRKCLSFKRKMNFLNLTTLFIPGTSGNSKHWAVHLPHLM